MTLITFNFDKYLQKYKNDNTDNGKNRKCYKPNLNFIKLLPNNSSNS